MPDGGHVPTGQRSTRSHDADDRSPQHDRRPRAGRPGRTALLECRGVCKRFGPAGADGRRLRRLPRRGGGARRRQRRQGKSTLIKAIAGIEPADAGTFSFDGVPVAIRSPGDATGVTTLASVVTPSWSFADRIVVLYVGRHVATFERDDDTRRGHRRDRGTRPGRVAAGSRGPTLAHASDVDGVDS